MSRSSCGSRCARAGHMAHRTRLAQFNCAQYSCAHEHSLHRHRSRHRRRPQRPRPVQRRASSTSTSGSRRRWAAPAAPPTPSSSSPPGYAACFHSALKLVAGRARADTTDSEVVADVGIGANGQGGLRPRGRARGHPRQRRRGPRPRSSSRRPTRSAPTPTPPAATSRSLSPSPDLSPPREAVDDTLPRGQNYTGRICGRCARTVNTAGRECTAPAEFGPECTGSCTGRNDADLHQPVSSTVSTDATTTTHLYYIRSSVNISARTPLWTRPPRVAGCVIPRPVTSYTA